MGGFDEEIFRCELQDLLGLRENDFSVDGLTHDRLVKAICHTHGNDIASRYHLETMTLFSEESNWHNIVSEHNWDHLSR